MPFRELLLGGLFLLGWFLAFKFGFRLKTLIERDPSPGRRRMVRGLAFAGTAGMVLVFAGLLVNICLFVMLRFFTKGWQ